MSELLEMEITEKVFVSDLIPGVGPDQVRINERDKELFSILLKQKFLTFELIAQKFEPKLLLLSPTERALSSLYRRLRRLVTAGYLQNAISSDKRLYLLTEKGLKEIENRHQLSLTSSLDLGAVEHDLACAEMGFYLQARGMTHWTPERVLRVLVQKLHPGGRKVPDGAMRTKSYKALFLEVEFSQKAQDRYNGIYRHYSREGGPDLIMYVYRDRPDVAYLMSLAETNPKFAFFPYRTPLSAPKEWVGFEGSGCSITMAEFLEQ